MTKPTDFRMQMSKIGPCPHPQNAVKSAITETKIKI